MIYQENLSSTASSARFRATGSVLLARTHGFTQVDPLTHRTVTPFRLTQPDVYYELMHCDVQLQAFDGWRMDCFVGAQGKAVLEYEKAATPAQRFSVGALSMYHIDCDTIPYLWAYAKRFTLFDNFYQALRAPSTPSNVEMIAAQNGLTQYARSPKERSKGIDEPGDPFLRISIPHSLVHNGKTPKHTQINQTYATIFRRARSAAKTRAP